MENMEEDAAAAAALAYSSGEETEPEAFLPRNEVRTAQSCVWPILYFADWNVGRIWGTCFVLNGTVFIQLSTASFVSSSGNSLVTDIIPAFGLSLRCCVCRVL